MNHRLVRVLIETERHRIAGMITVSRDGYRSRVSDVLNASEKDFISLTDCVVELIGHDGPGPRQEFLDISRPPSVMATPEGGNGPAEAEDDATAAGALTPPS